MRITRLPGTYAVVRLDPVSDVSKHMFQTDRFVSATKTEDELSLVLPSEDIPGTGKVEDGWTLFKVAGPLDFSLTGIMADLSGTLAKNGISLFALSTFDTDYILVMDAEAAASAWRDAGHEID